MPTHLCHNKTLPTKADQHEGFEGSSPLDRVISAHMANLDRHLPVCDSIQSSVESDTGPRHSSVSHALITQCRELDHARETVKPASMQT